MAPAARIKIGKMWNFAYCKKTCIVVNYMAYRGYEQKNQHNSQLKVHCLFFCVVPSAMKGGAYEFENYDNPYVRFVPVISSIGLREIKIARGPGKRFKNFHADVHSHSNSHGHINADCIPLCDTYENPTKCSCYVITCRRQSDL